MRLLAFLCLCCAACPCVAFGDGGHDDGFFLRLSTGLGYGQVSGDNDNSGTFKGASGQWSIGIGGIVTNNLAIHADFFGASLFDPEYEQDGTTTTLPDNIEVTMRTAALGVGLTYYFMPLNLYLCGSLGIAYASTEVRYTVLNVTFTDTYESETGVGLNLMVGKEWWVSESWGLGVAGQLVYVNIPVKNNNVDDSVSGASFGVLFSATYN